MRIGLAQHVCHALKQFLNRPRLSRRGIDISHADDDGIV
jgi:hypothetical protein